MKSYSLDNLKKEDNSNLYNLMGKTIVDNKQYNFGIYTVEDDDEMRIDKICYKLYGNTYFVEELMKINDIICPWALEVGYDLKYFLEDDVYLFRDYDKDDATVRQNLSNPNKNTQKDANRDTELPPTVMPKGLKQLDVDKEQRKIKIMDRFQ